MARVSVSTFPYQATKAAPVQPDHLLEKGADRSAPGAQADPLHVFLDAPRAAGTVFE